ncbi:hypothetical protein ASPBRDRAFT_197482 [Aspergillus brasiliensis CBS 101740]|uniref:Lysine-specific metallo-endopeptidase domain-containing protein n=1 Tax=Aspergillus brasiliensis (strain CBS 101740 / IMI 381727 / IBT 21946) TaxID=767769 RepID=A0A1L9UDL2_ASPBC|nr:hypothetical protein ASPBRDRAFT_197482 [Aspergillus brasiliensis CBS 101740]
MQYAADDASDVAYSNEGAYLPYRDIFFAESLLDESVFVQNVRHTFDRMLTMVSGQSEFDDAKFTVTCKNLQGCDRIGWFAMMNNKNRLNFCPRFFTDDYLKSSTSALARCDSINLKDTYLTRAAAILHEVTHTNYIIEIVNRENGDSYAAGMGTGTTTSDSCRMESNSYAELVQEWFNTEDFTYTNYACSGDIISFNLYVPSYITFFNKDTTDCESTTFWYERRHYDQHQSGNYVWLTTDLRKELNNLIHKLNSLIQSTISDINTARNTEQIHYINIDYALTATAAESTNTTKTDEITALMDAGLIQLPDADTCQAVLGSDPDPYAVFMCNVAVHVKSNSSSLIAQSLDQANQAIANKDYSSQDVSWWLPTGQIKTFHARSPGMMFYAGAAVGEMLSDWGFENTFGSILHHEKSK